MSQDIDQGVTDWDPDAIPFDVADRASTVQSVNDFGIRLWRELSDHTGNLAISPASLSTTLAMAHAGARGETCVAMDRVLTPGSGRSAAEHASALGVIMDRIASVQRAAKPSSGAFRSLARMFADRSERAAISGDYLRLILNAFGAELETLDISGDPEGARARVNRWIEDRTERLIPALLAPGTIDSSTRMVLASALYFAAGWAVPFQSHATRGEPFWIRRPDGSYSTQAAMLMGRSGIYRTRACRRVPARMIEIPHVGGSTALIVILPDDVRGLTAVEDALDADWLDASIAAMTPAQVTLRLPRVAVQASPSPSLSLRDPLCRMGMARAFADDADFSGIAPASASGGMRLGAVAHQAVVRIDERGSEMAAASTAVVSRSATPPGVEFRVDRPFLYAIVDRDSGLILCLGRVVDPGGAGGDDVARRGIAAGARIRRS
jgi:serpin B